MMPPKSYRDHGITGYRDHDGGNRNPDGGNLNPGIPKSRDLEIFIALN